MPVFCSVIAVCALTSVSSPFPVILGNERDRFMTESIAQERCPSNPSFPRINL